MIRDFPLGTSHNAFRRLAPHSVPARICITNDIRDFAGFWPRSDRLATARCHVFQCSDILELHCETIAIARHATPLFVAIIGHNGEPLALLPLSIETDSRFTRVFKHTRVLKFLDGGMSDYNAPVVFPPVADWNTETVRTLWNTLRRHIPAFDIAIFEKMPERVGDLPNPLNLLRTSAREESGHGASLSGTWQDFATKLPGRRNLRRLSRRLSETGTLRFEVADTPEQYDRSVEALIRHKLLRCFETVGYNSFDHPGYRAYLSKARDLLYPAGPVCMFALKLDDRVIAANLCCAAGPRLIGQICSFDPHWHDYSPGRILIDKVFEWCFGNGITFYDFGIGNETYKNLYCNADILLRDAAIPSSAKGLVALLWRRTIDRLRQARRRL